jgi:hypothetical protein
MNATKCPRTAWEHGAGVIAYPPDVDLVQRALSRD